MNKLPFKSSFLAPDSVFAFNKNCLIQGQGGTDTARAYKLTLKLEVLATTVFYVQLSVCWASAAGWHNKYVNI